MDRAARIAEERQHDYSDWRDTARRYDPDDLSAYPRDMIRSKVARDPSFSREDTRLDLVNYLAMLDEVSPRPIKPDAHEHMSSSQLVAELKKRRDIQRFAMGCEL
jgi:hypothetical protein